MNSDKLEGFANNPKYISGIYNYCDRWCERCSFTARCLNYEIGEKHFNDSESREISNEKFWNKISDVFRITMEMLEEYAEELKIEINDQEILNNEFYSEDISHKIDDIETVNNAKKYSILVDEWFQSNEIKMIEKRKELIPRDNIDLSTPASLNTALKIDDATEIIRWYQFQICVKLKRAFFSRLNEENDFDEDYQKDSNGSAKVALIGIDRSIASWGKYYLHFDADEDDILNILLFLTNLRDKIENEFPEARLFVRAGFDD